MYNNVSVPTEKAVAKWQIGTLFKRLCVYAELGAQNTKHTKLHNEARPRQQVNSDVIFPPGLILSPVDFNCNIFWSPEYRSLPEAVQWGWEMYHYCVPARKHFRQGQKYPSHSVSSTPSHKMVYLNQVIIICGRGGRAQARKWIRFLSENLSLCIPESVRSGNGLSCPIRVQATINTYTSKKIFPFWNWSRVGDGARWLHSLCERLCKSSKQLPLVLYFLSTYSLIYLTSF